MSILALLFVLLIITAFYALVWIEMTAKQRREDAYLALLHRGAEAEALLERSKKSLEACVTALQAMPAQYQYPGAYAREVAKDTVVLIQQFETKYKE